MKRILAVTSAALMSASLLAVPAMAEMDKNGETGGPHNASGTMTGTDAEFDTDAAVGTSGSPAEDAVENMDNQTGGQHNADGAMTGTDAEIDEDGTTASIDGEPDETRTDLTEKEYETGGSSNAETD